MSTGTIPPDRLRAALHQTGYDWLVRFWGEDSKHNLEKTASDLEKFLREYQRRYKEQPDVLGLVAQNPTKAAAFLQPDTLLASREMKIMVWRILLGCEIRAIDFKYKQGGETSLRFRLMTPDGEEETYETHNASDFRVLRHIGITGVGDDSILQGFYALVKQD
jgi:hypothetical protein